MASLRSRALIGGGIVALASVTAVSLTLFAYINSVTQQRFDRALYERHVQLTVALNENLSDPGRLQTLLTDPAYLRPFSGRYWQVTGPHGKTYASPSLFGTTLANDHAPTDKLSVWTTTDSRGDELREMEQLITLDDHTVWNVVVAADLSDLSAERKLTQRSLLVAFALMALLGLGGAWAQTIAVLRPLRQLQRDVARRWDRGEALDAADYPVEVAPLVEDISELIVRKQDVVARARRQAADLAHALKTPSAILRNELELLDANGQDVTIALDAVGRIEGQISRSLGRMRASSATDGVTGPADVSVSADRFRRLFGPIAEREGKTLEVRAEPNLRVRADQRDIEEIVGNLLDNARKWARSTIWLTARAQDDHVILQVEDDGPGIPDAARIEVLEAGRRLDTAKPGAGLGLAIVSDLVSAHGARLTLDRSANLGGLAAVVTFPARSS